MTPDEWERVKRLTADPAHPLHRRFWKDGKFRSYGAWPGATRAGVTTEEKRWKSSTRRVEETT